MARFYSNENFPRPVVLTLRTLGHDVLTIQETGRADQALPQHAGIMVCTFDADFTAQAERIHQAVAGRDSLAGQLIRVNRA